MVCAGVRSAGGDCLGLPALLQVVHLSVSQDELHNVRGKLHNVLPNILKPKWDPFLRFPTYWFRVVFSWLCRA